MSTFNLVASCLGCAAAIAQIISLVLQIRSTRAISQDVRSGVDLSTTTVINLQLPPRPETQGTPSASPPDPRVGGPEPWLVFLGGLAAMLAVATLYTRYRPFVLLVIAVLVFLCLAVNTYTTAVLHRQQGLGQAFLVGSVMIQVNFFLVGVLLVHLTRRETPEGPYPLVARSIRDDGVGWLISHQETLFFIVCEVLALLYATAVILVLSARQLANLSLISAALRGRTPSRLARFAPGSSTSVWSLPLFMLAVLAFVTLFSSAWFSHYLATRPLAFFR